MLTQAQLKRMLRYDPRTGDFYWRESKQGRRPSRVGNLSRLGYWRICINYKSYQAHRLAWLYVHGYMPKQLDHKNRNTQDNRITNLRLATQAQNRLNANGHSQRSISGFKGVNFQKHGWGARVQINGKVIWLGYFKTARAAHAAYCKKAKELHREFFYSGRG